MKTPGTQTKVSEPALDLVRSPALEPAPVTVVDEAGLENAEPGLSPAMPAAAWASALATERDTTRRRAIVRRLANGYGNSYVRRALAGAERPPSARRHRAVDRASETAEPAERQAEKVARQVVRRPTPAAAGPAARRVGPSTDHPRSARNERGPASAVSAMPAVSAGPMVSTGSRVSAGPKVSAGPQVSVTPKVPVTPTVSSVAGASPTPEVVETPKPKEERSGFGRVLDYLAEHAHLVPGFRMLTIVLGINPINWSPVERNAGNILRALVEVIPGGALITTALANYGLFERAGAWIEQQVAALAISGAAIRRSIIEFVDSLGWSDLFDLGGVWKRAKSLFMGPIDRLVAFARGAVGAIVQLIKDTILRPLAERARGWAGYDLLRGVLGFDPISGDMVERTPELLIGGFMKMIGQEEVWNRIREANAIERAWAWFQGALAGLVAFVAGLPTRFLEAFRALRIDALLELPSVIGRIVGIFTGAIGQLGTWALQQVVGLLEIIFEVVAPGAIPYLRRAAGAFRTILEDPIGFVGNLVRAGIQGFTQFAGNFLGHLRTSLIEWLTGALSGSGIYIPRAFELEEIVKLVLSVLGVTWDSLREKLVRRIGEPAVAKLEDGFDLVVSLVREGPATIWDRIAEGISNLREMVVEQVTTFVQGRVVQPAITRLLASLNPVGAFIQAILAIYDTILFFVERLRQIAEVAMAFIDSIATIAGGIVAEAANRVEQTMAGMLTLVIGFLARIAGLGRVGDAVVRIVERIRAPVDKALERVVDWIVRMARRVGRLLGIGEEAEREEEGDVSEEGDNVKVQAKSALLSRLRGSVTAGRLETAVRQVLVELRPQGLRRLEVQDVTGIDELSVVAEASPSEQLMKLVPKGRKVKMHVSIKLSKPYEPPENASSGEAREALGIEHLAELRKPSGDQERATGGRHLGFLPIAERPSYPRARGIRGGFTEPRKEVSGGVLVAPGPGSRQVDILTWNTGGTITGSTYSHAERQFHDWIQHESTFRARIVSIHVELNVGPCGEDGCVQLLNEVYDLLLPAAQEKATIHWSEPHCKNRPTTAADRAELKWKGPKGPVVDEDDAEYQVE